MAERTKATVLKTVSGATRSWVRIPLLPPRVDVFARVSYRVRRPRRSHDAAAESPSAVTQPDEPSVPDSLPDCDRNNIDCVEALGEYLADSADWTGMQADSFVLAYQVCSVYPPEDFVDQGYATGGSTDPGDVARAYAEETFVESSWQPGYEGCLSAFEGRP
jgi:hypothetical protein